MNKTLKDIIKEENPLDDPNTISFSKFQLYKKLGKGAFGTVFLAKHR